MSNADVIAAVTTKLINLLSTKDATLRAGSVSLDRLSGDSPLNLYLYQIVPDAARRNSELQWKTRPGEGAVPPLALSLRYLMTAIGGNEVQAQTMLGHAMKVLHENPIVLPPNVDAPYENARITMRSLSIEELERIWMGAQIPRRLSVGYDVDVVLIESSVPPRAPLPVLRRGPPGDLDTVTVGAGLPPAIERLEIGDGEIDVWLRRRGQPGRPSAEVGFALGFRGADLDRATTAVVTSLRRPHMVARFPLEVKEADLMTAELKGTAAFPFLDAAGKAVQGTFGADFPAGPCSVELEFPSSAVAVRTNAMPFMLAPSLAPTLDGNGLLSLTIVPPILSRQTVVLLIGGRAIEFNTDVPTANPSFDLLPIDLAGGVDYPIRLRVDGADSNVVALVNGQLTFDAARSVKWAAKKP